MAKIPKSGIANAQTIQASHITNIIEALDGTGSYDVVATGSFTGSFTGDGSGLTGVSGTNFANTSLTFDDNRAHDLNGFRVIFESASLNVFGISNTGVNVNAGQADRDFRVYTQGNTSTLFVEGSSDRVGVGKNTPNATLDVNGNAIITGSLSITGTSTFTTNNVNIGVGTVAILADADSAIDLSAAGANSGGGLVIPTGSITEAQEGSMYFDANETRLYIYDGSEWRFVTLT